MTYRQWTIIHVIHIGNKHIDMKCIYTSYIINDNTTCTMTIQTQATMIYKNKDIRRWVVRKSTFLAYKVFYFYSSLPNYHAQVS